MSPIVECVANYSEARRTEVVDAIVSAGKAVPGVTLLDRESDADHNRSVLTFVGPPEAVSEAAFQSIATAAHLIDLDQHRGEHPRIGATDVVPFVPIEGVTMADCVELARALGQRVGTSLGIPVYLYEAAATRPDRENLANLRKGEYEGLKDAIGSDPDRAPDFGPSKLGQAGATVIGARAPLIAYNIYLSTSNVDIAKRIAKAIRHSNGGLRYVKALGLLVNGKAQVSMNLTDYTQTPVHRAVEMIRREAARYGVSVESSELIGLIPQRALIDAAQWYLQIDEFQPDQILENRLASTAAGSAGDSACSVFLDKLGASTPTPGGGSAAAYSGAMAAALIMMVAGVTVGKKKYADVEGRMQAILAEATDLRNKLQAAVQADADAFNVMMDAFKLPRDNDKEKAVRDEAVEKASHRASEIPLETCGLAARVLDLAAEVAETGNANAVTDAGTAGALAGAAVDSAGMNVKINARSVNDHAAASRWLADLAEIEAQARHNSARLHAAIRERGRIEV